MKQAFLGTFTFSSEESRDLQHGVNGIHPSHYTHGWIDELVKQTMSQHANMQVCEHKYLRACA